MKQSLVIPAASAAAEIERKRSRFIALLDPAESRSQVDSLLSGYREKYSDARHIIYAFRLGGYSREILGMTDAGEPKGTAGRPVMDVLAGRDLTNSLITVVRYFGGVKLGTGGLARAYGDAAREVIEAASLHPLVDMVCLRARVPYSLVDAVHRLFVEYGADVQKEVYDVAISVQIALPATQADAFCQAVRDISAATVEFIACE